MPQRHAHPRSHRAALLAGGMLACGALAVSGTAAGRVQSRAVPETPKVRTVVLHRAGPSGDGPVLVLRTSQVRRSRGDRVEVFARPGHSQQLIAAWRRGQDRWKLSSTNDDARPLLRKLARRVRGGGSAPLKVVVVTALPIGNKISRFEIEAYDEPTPSL